MEDLPLKTHDFEMERLFLLLPHDYGHRVCFSDSSPDYAFEFFPLLVWLQSSLLFVVLCRWTI